MSEGLRSAGKVICLSRGAPSPVVPKAAGRIEVTRDVLMRPECDAGKWGSGGRRIVRIPETMLPEGQTTVRFEGTPVHG